MRPARWRAFMVPVIICAALFVLLGNFVQIQRDDFGLSYSPAATRRDILVQGVAPHSAAAAAGIRKGDVVRIAGTPVDRRNFAFPAPGVRVPVIVNGSRRVSLVGAPAQSVPFDNNIEFKIVRIAYLLIALLLALRRPDDRAARALVVFLLVVGFGISLNNNAFLSPLASQIVLQMLSTVLLLYGMGAGARFAAIFPSGQAPPAARALANAATTCSTIGIAAFLGASLYRNASNGFIVVATVVVYGAFLFSLALLFATLVERYVHAPPGERTRRLWIFAILAFGLLGPGVDLVVQLVSGFNQAVDQYASLTLIVIPIGLAYVILRHRVIDVGFVLNRAAVYGLMSIFIVGVFVVVETLMAKYVETSSHVTSTAVQLAVALTLGFSIRALHSRVDAFVDTVLFRERHEAEAAIRDFAHDAPYLTDAGVLETRCVETVMRYGAAAAAGVWLRRESGRYVPAYTTFTHAQPVDENDPAVVAMRARRIVADLASIHGSRLPGSLAFPMVVRGELLGTLVCGVKTHDETYAPDEVSALEALATAVGHAYDALEIRELRRRFAESRLATEGAVGMS